MMMGYKVALVWIGRLLGLGCFVVAAMMASDASNETLMTTDDRQMLFVFSAMTLAAIGVVMLIAAEILDSVTKARHG